MSYLDDLESLKQAGISQPGYYTPGSVRPAPGVRAFEGPLSEYTATAGVPAQDYGGLNAALGGVRNRALGTGPSPWMNAMLARQGTEQKGAADQAADQGASNLAMARSSLAMRGGLTGGASERAALSGARDLNSRQQDVSRQGQLQRQDIGIEDERQRQQMLSQLPGMETQALGAHLSENQMLQHGQEFNAQNQLQNEQFNIRNAIEDAQHRNNFNQQQYGQQMAQFGSSALADQMNAEAQKRQQGPFNPAGLTNGGKVEGKNVALGALAGGPIGAIGGTLGGAPGFLLNPIGSIVGSFF